MEIPTTLKHKPVFDVQNYENVDGRSAYESDAKGLSLGLAQWNERGKVEVSAKVWRYTGQKWSRQSEELPLHRVLDLAILICRARLFVTEQSYKHESGYDESQPLIDRIPMQGDAMTVAVSTDNPMIKEDLALFEKCLKEDDELLSERFSALSKLLQRMSY